MDELGSKFGFTSHDVTFLITKGLLQPFIEVNHFHFIAGRMVNNRFLGNATGFVTGKVFVLERHILELLKKGKVSTNLFYLRGREDIFTWSPAKPPNMENLKNEIYSWSPTTIEDVKWPALITTAIKTEANYIKNLFKDISESSGKGTPEERMQILGVLNKYSDQVSFCPSITIQTEDIFVSSENIKAIQSKKSIKSDTNTSVVKNLVEHLMKMYPAKGGSALYKLLVTEFNKENDDIDPNAILIYADDSNIVYRSPSGKEAKIVKKRFLNIVSEIKNKK